MLRRNAIEVTRRTVIETGTTALLLTALPRAAVAAGSVDNNELSAFLPVSRRTSESTAILIR